jgi:circadian clock protein KaiC
MARGDLLVERCPSGIPGFDELCQGGFVRHSVNAVLGGPGSGKSTFLVQFLYNGVVKYKENGLYISFEPDILELFKDALTFGWDLQKLEEQQKCIFIKISPDTDVAELKKDLTAKVAKYQIKRICLDPISLFKASEGNEAKTRMLIFDLSSMLKRLGVTVIVSDETASGDTEEIGVAASSVKSQYIKFLVDSLTDLYSSGLGGVSDRAIRIAKMRRTNHIRGPIPMQISDDGISVIPQKGKKGAF